MAVLLCILKWIGIILLIIIGILLTIIFCLLFVPVRYRIKGAYFPATQCDSEADANHYFFKVNTSWFLHIFSFHFNLDHNEMDSYFQILCFKIRKSDKSAKSAKKEKSGKESDHKTRSKASGKETTKTPELINKTDTREQLTEKTESADAKEKQTELKEVIIPDETSGSKEIQKTGNDYKDASSESASKKKGLRELFGKVKEFITGIKKIIHKIRYTFKNIYDKITNIGENIHKWKEFLTDDATIDALHLTGNELKRILKELKPRKIKGSFDVGFEDCCTTGDLLAIYSIFYPFIGNHFKLTPHFDESVLQGDLFIKGRFKLIILLIAAWKLYFDKNIKAIIEKWQKGEL